MLNKDFSEAANLISTTDPTSRITYANSEFCEIAGFEDHELIGHAHKIVRHNDMPKAAFSQMWEYLKSGKSWMGLVKNQCKDNKHHYWVSAFVTPIHDPQGNVLEYQSVRSKPSKEQVERAENLYKLMANNKVSNLPRVSFHTINIIGLLILLGLLIALTIFFSHWLLVIPTLLNLLIFSNTLIQNKRYGELSELSKQAYQNELMERPYTKYKDDYSCIELALMMRKAELRAVS